MEGQSRHNCKSVDWDVKNLIRQKTLDCNYMHYDDIDSWL